MHRGAVQEGPQITWAQIMARHPVDSWQILFCFPQSLKWSQYTVWEGSHSVMYIESSFFLKVRKIALFSRTMDLFWLETP